MRKAPYRRVELTPQQQRKWEDTLGALSWVGPGFIHIIYTMLAQSGHKDTALFTDQLEWTAATDGYQIIIQPERFFKYDLMERVFIVLHEVMHEILNHVRLSYAFHARGEIEFGSKKLPFSHDHANNIQDYIINAILVASKLGKFNPEWLYDTDIADDNAQWVERYFHWWRDKPKGGRSSNGAFDAHLPPGDSTDMTPEEMPPRNEQQWEIVTKQAFEIQRAQGVMTSSLEMFFEEVLRPKVPWSEHVRGLILRLAGSGAYDWQKLDRRLVVRGIGAPGMTGYGAGVLVVGGDSSGSLFHDPNLIARLLGEIGGIMEDLQPEEVHVVWCDHVIKRVDICRDMNDVRKMIYDGILGGGGTSFVPVFKYIEDNELRPDALIYLTDGYGEFPKRAPDYPVIWGSITDASYPFGTVVRVPVEAD